MPVRKLRTSDSREKPTGSCRPDNGARAPFLEGVNV